MKNNTLSQSKIEEINNYYVRNIDKFYRMFSGLSSNLERYEDGIIYLEITNNQAKILSTYNTAVKFSYRWRDNNPELNNAKGFVVIFLNTNVAQGGSFSANQSPEQLVQKMKKVLHDMENDSPELGSIYSGRFTKELEDVEQDLTKDNL